MRKLFISGEGIDAGLCKNPSRVYCAFSGQLPTTSLSSLAEDGI